MIASDIKNIRKSKNYIKPKNSYLLREKGVAVMRNEFIFYPVGHGLFYAGILHDLGFSFVYDCGTRTKGVDLRYYIGHLSKRCNKPLDFVAISHFHKDHYSGIDDLLNIIDAKYIFTPYISTNRIVRLTVLAAIMSILGYSGSNILKILDVLEKQDELEWQVEEEENYSFFGAKHTLTLNGWRFVFLSKMISPTKEQALNKSINLLTQNGAVSLQSLIRAKSINKIKSAYEKVFGKGNTLNETSLIMLHYPLPMPTNYEVFVNDCCFSACSYRFFEPTTLMTGDAKIDGYIASTIYSFVNDEIGIIQVPHHGSYSNWTSMDSNLNVKYALYLVGKGITQKVSKISTTLKELADKEYNIVDEKHGYVYWIY